MNVSQTDSNLVEYITLDAVTRAAAPTAESATKPEAAMTLGRQTAAVRTIAVWMPVTEQQLGDVPQIQNLIDVELRYDVRQNEELQIVWGRGTGENLLGIMKTTGVIAGRIVGGDTLLDKIKRAATDVAVDSNGSAEPNAVLVHPLDWEAIVLLKATTNEYLWIVVTDANGANRIWGLSVVETTATRDTLDLVNTTKKRVVVVGDFIRGATLWDRMDVRVDVGYINDQFVKNQRTIRAEERLAFGVKRVTGFRFVETVAAAA